MPDDANVALTDAREALQRLADELNRNPANVEVWLQAAAILSRFGEFSQAENSYRRVLAIDPRHNAARFGLAATLIDQNGTAAAEPIVRKIVADHPQTSEAWALLASLRQKQVRDGESAEALSRALALSPNPAYHSNLLQIMQYADDVSPTGLLAAHQQWNALYAAPIHPIGAIHPIRPSSPTKKLRLGFVSSDFGQHPIGYLILRPLECLDKSQAAIVCYYDRAAEDSYTARFRAAADAWHVSADWSDDRLAQQIQDDEIDILFDLMGHTGGRLLCFARKPAPVQVSWAGYVGTTGLDAMNFLLADRFHVREGEESFYVERILRMPNGYVCYEPPGDTPEVAPLPALSAGHVTFGCFNNMAKFSSRILDAWADILRRVPDARLLLKNRSLDQPELRDRLHAHFATHGVPPSSVMLEGGAPHQDLMAAYGRVDLALDTQPYSGGLTTCEALWMGVPVVTFPGATFAGRHSVSHLSNAGLSQFIASDLAGYIDLAVRWAVQLEELAAIRTRLRDQLHRSMLCDAPQFALDLMNILLAIKASENTHALRNRTPGR